MMRLKTFSLIIVICLLCGLAEAKDYAKRYPTDTALEVYTPTNPPPSPPAGTYWESATDQTSLTGGKSGSFDLTTTGTGTFDHIVETTPTLLKLDQTTPQTVSNVGTLEFTGITQNGPADPTGTPTASIDLLSAAYTAEGHSHKYRIHPYLLASDGLTKIFAANYIETSTLYDPISAGLAAYFYNYPYAEYDSGYGYSGEQYFDYYCYVKDANGVWVYYGDYGSFFDDGTNGAYRVSMSMSDVGATEYAVYRYDYGSGIMTYKVQSGVDFVDNNDWSEAPTYQPEPYWYGVNVSWTAVSGADGYVVLKEDSSFGSPLFGDLTGWDVATNSLADGYDYATVTDPSTTSYVIPSILKFDELDLSGHADIGGTLNVMTDNLVVTSEGKVGIGTTTPASRLNIHQATTGLKGLTITGYGLASTSPYSDEGIAIFLNYNGTGNRQTVIGATDAIGSSTKGMFRFLTGGEGYAAIDSISGDGLNRLLTLLGTDTTNVAVGYADNTVTASSAKLNVFNRTNDGSRNNLLIQKWGTASGDYLQVKNKNGTVLASMNNSGYFGVGTTNAYGALEGRKTGTTLPGAGWGNLALTNGGSYGANSGGVINFGGQYSSAGAYTEWAAISGLKDNGTSGQYGGYLAFYTRANGASTTERLRIASNGDIYLKADNQQLYFGTGNDANMGYDGTNFIINPKVVGSGYLNVKGQILVDDKIAFTQTDGNEYIDSLADGYMDYGATTQHRFNNTINLGGATNYINIATDGDITWAGTSKKKLTLRPTLVPATTLAGGVPTQIERGLNEGYSLPIWSTPANQYEQLSFRVRIPICWDGTTDPQVGITVTLSGAEDVGDKFQFQLEWQTETKGDVMGTTTSNTTSEQTVLTGRAEAYDTYFVYFNLNADDATNHINAGDMLQCRLRRIAASSLEVANEIIVWDWATMWCVDKVYGDWSVEANDT